MSTANTAESLVIVEIPSPILNSPVGIAATRLVLQELAGNSDPSNEELAQYREEEDALKVFAALSPNDTLLGTGALGLYRGDDKGLIASICDLVVSKEARKRGVASRLLACLEDEARIMNAHEVFLLPTPDYVSFYDHRGYKEAPRPYLRSTAFIKSLID